MLQVRLALSMPKRFKVTTFFSARDAPDYYAITLQVSRRGLDTAGIIGHL